MSKQKWTERTDHDIAAWWSPEDMQAIQGTVLDGKVIRGDDGEPRLIWVLELTEPAMLHKAGDANAAEFPVGTIAGVGHRSKLAPVLNYFKSYTDFDVRIMPVEKRRIKGGRHMWLMRVATSGGTPRRAPIILEAPVAARQLTGRAPKADDAEFEEADSEIPF